MSAARPRRLHRRIVHALSVAAFVTIALVGFTGVAAAAARRRMSSLSWVLLPGAESCIAEAELSQAVERRLGRAVFVPRGLADVFIEARAEPLTPSGGFRAHLVLTDGDGRVLGKRDLETPEATCGALDEQLALVLALLIDHPAPTSPPRPPEPPGAPPQERRSSPLLPSGPPRPPQRAPWRATVDMDTALAEGILPGVALGILLRGEITPPSFVPIQLGGARWRDPTWSAARAGTSSQGTLLSLSWGFLSACPLLGLNERLRLRGCGGAMLGAIRSDGFGFRTPMGSTQLVAAATAEGRLTWRVIGPLEIDFGLEILVPVARARFFFYDETGAERDLYRMSAVAGTLHAGAGLAFP